MESMIWLTTPPHMWRLCPKHCLSSPKYARWNRRGEESLESWGQQPARGFSAGTTATGAQRSEALEMAKAWRLSALISLWGGKYKFRSLASSRYSNLVGIVHKIPTSTKIWCEQRKSRLFWSFLWKYVLLLIGNNKTPQQHEVVFSLCQQRLIYTTRLSVCAQPEYSFDEVRGQVTDCI